MIPAIVAAVIATLASGVFFGAALYINVVEQPARMSCGVPLAVREWRPSYKRGTLMQAPLALIGSVIALATGRRTPAVAEVLPTQQDHVKAA